MRALSATLLANQKSMGLSIVKSVLTFPGEDTKTYEADRILDIVHPEQPWRQAAEVLLDNSDGEFTDLDLRGYQSVLSYGYHDVVEGDEYSAAAPLKVMSSQTHDLEGLLVCSLSMAGLVNRLSQDRASAAYTQDASNTDTVKDLIDAIMGSTLAPFTHCTAYTVTYDLEDALIDAFQPKDAFGFTKNQSRQAIVKRLLAYTHCVLRFEADGNPHVFKVRRTEDSSTWAGSTAYSLGDIVEPTTPNYYYYVCTSAGNSGGTEPATWSTTIGGTVSDGTVTWTVAYHYEYTLTEGDHQFFSKAYRRRLVIPNYIQVDSFAQSGDGYSGYAEDTDSSDRMEVRRFRELKVTGNAQAADIAAAMLSKYQIDAEKGSGKIPMNVGAEVYDFSHMVSSRASDRRQGNIGYLNRHWKAGMEDEDPTFEMELRFGSVALGGQVGTMPPQYSSNRTTYISGGGADYGSSITELWAAIDGIWAVLDMIIAYLENEALLNEEERPEEAPPTGQQDDTWVTLFDGGVDTPSSVAWVLEAGVPFTVTGRLYFSPILEGDWLYVIDRGTEFWAYNLFTHGWYKMPSPTYDGATLGSLARTLVPSPNGSKLACISEVTNNHRGGKRIEIFSFSTNSWFASSQIQNLDDQIPLSKAQVISALVWADEDTIWCWASEATAGTKDYIRCVKYAIGADTFTPGALENGGLTFAAPYSSAINAAGTIIYGSAIGATIREWYKYTIAANTYASGGTLTAGRAFALAHDDDKLWYVTTADYRKGYIDTADDSENDNKFAENTDRTASYGLYFGVRDNLADIVEHAKSTTPELMAVRDGGMYTLGTIYATGVTRVYIEKPSDDFPVTLIETTTNTTLAFDNPVGVPLSDGDWKVYYPTNGDYSQVIVKYQVL